MLERVQNKTRDATCAAERVAEVTLHQWSLAPPARSASRFYFWILGVLDAATRHGNGALVPVKIEVARLSSPVVWPASTSCLPPSALDSIILLHNLHHCSTYQVGKLPLSTHA